VADARAKLPRPAAIVAANAALLATLPNAAGLDPSRACWACGFAFARGAPQRAHVAPASAGGSSDPGNFLLLCAVCHREQPDGQPRAAQEAWLRSRENWRFRRTPEIESALEELRRLAAEAGGDRAIAAFHTAIGDEGLRVLMSEGYDRAAGPSRRTALANAGWRVVEAFQGWVARGRE
jgi:hypothetical protein